MRSERGKGHLAAISLLNNFVKDLRNIIPQGCKEDVNVLAHSQGTMVTASALAERGLKLQNVVLLNSPINVKTQGAKDMAKAAADAARIYYYWSPKDTAVRLINGNKPIVGPTTSIQENVSANFTPIEIGGSHGHSLTAQLAYAKYADNLKSDHGTKLIGDFVFRKKLADLLQHYPGISIIGERVLKVNDGKVTLPK